MNNRNEKHSSKYDTAKIPITRIEKEIIDNRNNQKYNQNITNQSKPDHSTKRITKSKQKQSFFSKFILSLLLIISIISGSLLGYIYSLCSKTDYKRSENLISINTTNIRNNIYNILLIGTDKEEDGASRSDSMILVTINKNQKTIKLTSFMRDLWVKIPGHDYMRLNAAYSIGGADLLLKTIEKNFEIEIDNYIVVNFDMFKELIDGIGGVTVDITETEANFINRTTHAKVTTGQNNLNGDYALIYCRIRKLDSDFSRTQRQRKVINAIINKIRSQNILTTVSVASEVLPFITSDISPLNMTTKVFSAVSYLQYSTEQIRIPADGTYQNKTINSQAVLVPDFEESAKLIHEFIY